MHINLNNSAGSYPQLSPLLQLHTHSSPYLSPLADGRLRKYSFENDDFMNFKLEEDQEEDRIQIEQGADNSEDQVMEGIHLSQRNDYLLDHLENKYDQVQVGLKQEQEEYIDNPPTGKYDHSSTKFMEVKEESQPHHFSLLASNVSRVQLLIEFLVQNSHLKQQILAKQSQKYTEDSDDLREIFNILLQKFKKLKKTKEEMTKYCMRKAFKFIADKMKRDRTHNRDVDSCMRIYFESHHTSHNFTIPFKKNSVQKTMNGNFLKRVFSSSVFVDDYREFIRDFKEIMLQDNEKKIKYLSDMVEEHLSAKEVKKIESIKRLPWTKDTLNQTENLGMSLLSYAQNNEGTLTLLKREEIEQQ